MKEIEIICTKYALFVPVFPHRQIWIVFISLMLKSQPYSEKFEKGCSDNRQTLSRTDWTPDETSDLDGFYVGNWADNRRVLAPKNTSMPLWLTNGLIDWTNRQLRWTYDTICECENKLKRIK